MLRLVIISLLLATGAGSVAADSPPRVVDASVAGVVRPGAMIRIRMTAIDDRAVTAFELTYHGRTERITTRNRPRELRSYRLRLPRDQIPRDVTIVALDGRNQSEPYRLMLSEEADRLPHPSGVPNFGKGQGGVDSKGKSESNNPVSGPLVTLSGKGASGSKKIDKSSSRFAQTGRRVAEPRRLRLGTLTARGISDVAVAEPRRIRLSTLTARGITVAGVTEPRRLRLPTLRAQGINE